MTGSPFLVGFLVVIAIAVYFILAANRRTEENAAVTPAPPPVDLQPLASARLAQRLSPGWYPNAAGTEETYFDGTSWGESRARSLQD